MAYRNRHMTRLRLVHALSYACLLTTVGSGCPAGPGDVGELSDSGQSSVSEGGEVEGLVWQVDLDFKPTAIVALAAGGSVVAGSRAAPDPQANSTLVVMRLSEDGEVEWSVELDGVASSVEALVNGDLVVGGRTDVDWDEARMLLAGISADGSIQWQLDGDLGTIEDVVTAVDSFYATGDPPATGDPAWVGQYSFAGELLWSTTQAPAADFDGFTALSLKQDTGVLVAWTDFTGAAWFSSYGPDQGPEGEPVSDPVGLDAVANALVWAAADGEPRLYGAGAGVATLDDPTWPGDPAVNYRDLVSTFIVDGPVEANTTLDLVGSGIRVVGDDSANAIINWLDPVTMQVTRTVEVASDPWAAFEGVTVTAGAHVVGALNAESSMIQAYNL